MIIEVIDVDDNTDEDIYSHYLYHLSIRINIHPIKSVGGRNFVHGSIDGWIDRWFS